MSNSRKDSFLKVELVLRLAIFCVLITAERALAWTSAPSHVAGLLSSSIGRVGGFQPFQASLQRQHGRTMPSLAAAVIDADSPNSSSPPPQQPATTGDIHQQEHVLPTDTTIAGPAFLSTMNEEKRQELFSKVTNGLFLTLCFGFAIGSILSIDQGMTRGWTQSVGDCLLWAVCGTGVDIILALMFCFVFFDEQEIAMRIPLDAWGSYEEALETSPVATKTLINVVIYLLGDWLSQTVFAKENILDFDLGRTLRNGLIGLCFGPLVHEYYQFSDYILPVEGGLGNRILKIMMDQSIYLVAKCSLYILAVNTLQGKDFETSTRAVKEKIGGIVVTGWKFWPLVHCITYSVIPARHRMLWVNCVDLVWNAILATMASQRGKESVDSTGDEVALVEDQQESALRVLASSSREVDDEQLEISPQTSSTIEMTNEVVISEATSATLCSSSNLEPINVAGENSTVVPGQR